MLTALLAASETAQWANGCLRMRIGRIWLALGANVGGVWGPPRENLAQATGELERLGLVIVRCSALYWTVPMGPSRQPTYANTVLEVRGSIGPAALLRLVKRLESRAGRRLTRRWGPRPLDIDILDFGGRRVGYGGETRPGGRLQLPHPGLEHRGFVLVPLAEVSPGWRHPRLGHSARDILRRNPRMRRGIVRARD